MKASDDMRQYSADTPKAARARGTIRTRAGAPAHPLDASVWDNACVVIPPPNKASVHFRLDADVLNWFRQQGCGHLTRMNAVLRSLMEAQRR